MSSAITATPVLPKTCCSARRSDRSSISRRSAAITITCLHVLDRVGSTDDPHRDGAPDRCDDDRNVRGLAAGTRIFRAIQLYQCRRPCRDLHRSSARSTAADARIRGMRSRTTSESCLSLPFKVVAARHRLDVLDDRMQQRILVARHAFRHNLPPDASGQIEFFDPERYNAAASLQDNILAGKIAFGEAEAPRRIPEVLQTSWRSCRCARRSSMSGLITMSAPPASRPVGWRNGKKQRSRARC